MTPKAGALVGFLVMGLIAGASDVPFLKSVGTNKLLAEVGPMVIGSAVVFMWLHYDGLQVG